MSHETFQAPELSQLAELLPAYDFHAFIAQGGMGAVYKATQRSLDRAVAIKILPREFGADPEFRKSFETEAKAMARLNHPNLIGVYDFGDVDGMPYIVMEFVNGKSLYHSAWNKAIDPEQAVSIVKGICHGLGHAHENGVIHRDIKPANILLTPKAEPKIGDFGLARPTDAEGHGLVMGTPGYTAPEFLEHHERADRRADLFAVGVILHELVTGHRPDPSGERTPGSTGDAKLDAIWKKATHPNPDQRYQSAEEMAAALEAWKPSPAARRLIALPPGGSPPAHAPATPVPAASPARPPAGAKPTGPPPAAPKVGSSWGVVRNLLIIATLIVAIGFVGKVYKEKKRTRDAERELARKEAFDRDPGIGSTGDPGPPPDNPGTGESATQVPDRPVDPPVAPAAEPTPMESLAKLRRKLAAGERDEMPKGTVRHGKSDWFLVASPMSWHEAASFAERHGGHLPIPDSSDDVSWLSQRVPADAATWLGVGRAAASGWATLDGSEWKLDQPRGVGDFAALNDLGLIRARKAVDKLPFLIQWHRDGSNPATLAAALGATRETLDSPNPAFPPGTRSKDARSILIVLRPIDRRDAARLAELAGGTLAIPATRDEARWLAAECEGLGAAKGLWLGGQRQGDLWIWDSGETWDFAQWADDGDHRDGGTGLVLRPDAGWAAAAPDEEASGFIIEWSRDAASAEADPAEIGEVAGGSDELAAKATQLVKAARKERADKLAANARTFRFDLDVWHRGLSASDKANWGPHVEGLKKLVQGNRVPTPDDFGPASKIALSEQMNKICSFCHKRQEEIDAAYEARLENYRAAYASRLESGAREALEQGQRSLARSLTERARAAADVGGWLASLDLAEGE